MRYLNASDHRWLCIESDTNPLQIGALIFLKCGEFPTEDFVSRALTHLEQRLPATPWGVRYQPAPLNIDSGAWLNVGKVDVASVAQRWPGDEPVTLAELNRFVCSQVMQRLPRDRPPVRITLFDKLDDSLRQHGDVAMMVQHHHAVADGIGFQNALESVMDSASGSNIDHGSPSHRERVPLAPFWVINSLRRSRAIKALDETKSVQRSDAAAQLELLRSDPEYKRQRTPEIPGFEGASSIERLYGFTEFDLQMIKDKARLLGGTVNDLVMTVVGGAVRTHLEQTDALDALGEKSVIALVPRSLRIETDGPYGNHITMILPTLGTHIASHHERFALIRKSVRAEIRRSQLSHESTPLYEKPFTARTRLIPEVGTSAGNLSVSNVPGPESARWFAGYEVASNYPTPSLVAGQLMNITLRRYCDHLHLGLMSEPSKMTSLEPFIAELHRVLREI